MVENTKVAIEDKNGVKFTMGGFQIDNIKGSYSQEWNVKDLCKRFPTVFNLSPKAMKRITPQMELMAVGLDDAEWVDGRIRLTSDCQY